MIEEQRIARIHDIIGQAFRTLAKEGFQPMEINGTAIGMCRKSMEELVGKEKAIGLDDVARERIGWNCAHVWTAGKRIGEDIAHAVCGKCGKGG